MPKLRHPEIAGLHVRVVLPGGGMMGPGRAELLRGVRTQGSIAAAGRAMGMSYRRAWMLLDETSRAFGTPLVAASPGGAQGGRASLTSSGDAVLALYDAIVAKAALATAADCLALQALSEISTEDRGEASIPT